MTDVPFNVNVGVGDFSKQCKLAPKLKILSKQYKCKIEKNNNFEFEANRGKLLHYLFQTTFKNDFDKILFRIERIGEEPSKAIENVLTLNFGKLKDFLVSIEDKNSNFNTLLGQSSADTLCRDIENHINGLSLLSVDIIYNRNGKNYNLLIDNEINLTKALPHGVFLKGKIDSMMIKEKNIKIIDIKSSSSKNYSHTKQLGIYAEMLSEIFQLAEVNIDFQLKAAIWYTNPSMREKYFEEREKKIKEGRNVRNVKSDKDMHYHNVRLNIEEKKMVGIENTINELSKNSLESLINEVSQNQKNSISCDLCGNLCKTFKKDIVSELKKFEKDRNCLDRFIPKS